MAILLNELLMRKGVYPYEYMDTWDRFTEPKLPPKEVFYSKHSDAHISDEDYTHAQKVWETFGCKTLMSFEDFLFFSSGGHLAQWAPNEEGCVP